MEIDESTEGTVKVLALSGRLDSRTARDLEVCVVRSADSGDRRILLDLSGLAYVSSAGLRVILMGAKKLQDSKGKLALCALNENIQEVFDVSGFSSILEVYDDRAEALAALSA